MGIENRNPPCKYCGNHVNNKRSKFCSRACLAASRQNYKVCVVCGATFPCSPSSKTITCSKECLSVRRSKVLRGRLLSENTKQKLSEAAKKFGHTANLEAGTPAAQASPLAGKSPENSSAKEWVLLSPSGTTYHCTNICDWSRKNANALSLFFPDGTELNVVAYRFAKGITALKNRIKLKRGCQTYKGWQLIGWDDRKNVEKKNYQR